MKSGIYRPQPGEYIAYGNPWADPKHRKGYYAVIAFAWHNAKPIWASVYIPTRGEAALTNNFTLFKKL